MEDETISVEYKNEIISISDEVDWILLTIEEAKDVYNKLGKLLGDLK